MRTREEFDRLLEQILATLPPHIHAVLEENPLVVDDEPTHEQLCRLQLRPETMELCGLHWGIPLTRRSVEHSGTLPDQIQLFRGPIVRIARTLHGPGRAGLREQIRVTLLHEIGHHFGLNETQLDELGYG